jgi:hypothetical protein
MDNIHVTFAVNGASTVFSLRNRKGVPRGPDSAHRLSLRKAINEMSIQIQICDIKVRLHPHLLMTMKK